MHSGSRERHGCWATYAYAPWWRAVRQETREGSGHTHGAPLSTQ